MANKQRGEVSFEADEKTWTMKIDTNAMCEIEELAGKPIAEVGQLLANPKTASMQLIRTVFLGSLKHYHDGLGVREVGEIMDDIGIAKAIELIGEAFSMAIPQEKKGKAAAKLNPQKGTPERHVQ